MQSEDDVEVKDDSILVAQQGEQDAATATIMATVDHHEGRSILQPQLIKLIKNVQVLGEIEHKAAWGYGINEKFCSYKPLTPS